MYLPETEHILGQVSDERANQNEKWGTQRNLENTLWATILGEEFGEVCQDILNHKDIESLRKELIQVAAVAVAFIEDLDYKEALASG